MNTTSRALQAAIALSLISGAAPTLAQSSEQRALEEVRNTVINLLDALVQKGVMTKEQAEAMVAAAQDKAAADAQERATQDAAESGAVRVTYVPETVKQDISKQVSAQITDDVTNQVVATARAEGWGVPGALPEWIKDVRLYGDVRARIQSDLFTDDNAENFYLDFNQVNDRGGIARANEAALLNTSEDRHRLVGRVRAGLAAQLGNDFSIDVRLASGNVRSPVSTNQTLGNYGGRWTLNVDKAAVLWNPVNDARTQEFDLRVGRFANPFLSVSELIWDNDLTFEGLSATYALDLFGRNEARMERGLFLTVGAFPLQEVELSSQDKWLYAGQLGGELPFTEHSRLRAAAGYYRYDNITGVRNPFDLTTYDYTAPRFLQKGNTLFDIRNDADRSTNLFALAGDYELVSASMWFDVELGSTNVSLGGEYVKNIGWKTDDVRNRVGDALYFASADVSDPLFEERTEGYDVMLTVGQPRIAALWDWRTMIGYRYVERDAVLDAFTDSDFHLGGTDMKGYQLGFDLGLARGAWLRLRYLSAKEIDGAPLSIDVWQMDLNGQF